MKYYSGLTIGLHGFLILVISIISAVVFTNSFIYNLLYSLISKIVSFENVYPFTAVTLLVALSGAKLIILDKEVRSGFLMIIVTCLCLPAVLETAGIRWLEIFGLETVWKGMSAPALLLFCAVIILSFILLAMTLHIDKNAALNKERGFTKEEIDTIYTKQISACLGTVFVTLVVIAVIYGTVVFTGFTVGNMFGNVKVDILFSGAASVLLLLSVLYISLISGHIPENARRKWKPFGRNKVTPEINEPSEITEQSNPWVCPRCGSDRVRQYQVATDNTKESLNNPYSWESHCLDCQQTWRW